MLSISAATLCLLAPAASAAPQTSSAAPAALQAGRANACFFESQFKNWTAPNDRTIYIRVDQNRYYRLDLVAPCAALTRPDARLITRLYGSNTICSAQDWNISVSQGRGDIPLRCLVQTMTPMTAEQVKAIPKKLRP
jgi:hypothetical protein